MLSSEKENIFKNIKKISDEKESSSVCLVVPLYMCAKHCAPGTQGHLDLYLELAHKWCFLGTTTGERNKSKRIVLSYLNPLLPVSNFTQLEAAVGTT